MGILKFVLSLIIILYIYCGTGHSFYTLSNEAFFLGLSILLAAAIVCDGSMSVTLKKRDKNGKDEEGGTGKA